MTPTLTNAQKYSPEFGFEPGVVVEVFDGSAYYFGVFAEVYKEMFVIHSKKYDDQTASNRHAVAFRLDDIKSIRLLSGKWAVWNFAPKGAVGCLYAENARTPVMFYKHPDTFAIDKLDPDMDGHFMSPPWWWLEGRK